MAEEFGMFSDSRIWNIRKSLNYLIKNRVIPDPRGRYLDLGTGQGEGAYVLRNDYGVEVLGIDMQGDQLVRGVQKGLLTMAEAVNENFFSYLGAQTERFDGVTAFLILTSSYSRAYDLATRALNPGGVVLFTANFPLDCYFRDSASQKPRFFTVPGNTVDKYCLIHQNTRDKRIIGKPSRQIRK